MPSKTQPPWWPEMTLHSYSKTKCTIKPFLYIQRKPRPHWVTAFTVRTLPVIDWVPRTALLADAESESGIEHMRLRLRRLIRRQDIWTIKPTANLNFSFRQVIKIADVAPGHQKLFITLFFFFMGRKLTVNLCLDEWLIGGCVCTWVQSELSQWNIKEEEVGVAGQSKVLNVWRQKTSIEKKKGREKNKWLNKIHICTESLFFREYRLYAL